jgi:hypothetical protein
MTNAPADQAPTGLGDTASVPCAGEFYLDRLLEGFSNDPPDSDFQDGFMACADTIRRESGYHEVHAALVVFEEAYGEHDDDLLDDTPVVVQVGGRTTLYSLTVADFRRARAALAKARGQ